ncbi:DUF4091 domain-containing protein [Singulisphaera acidiphila]|uniref:Glycoside hydrolase 123 catalytic domain-containing protein n=1 Tax=Singulisphaera acidiphila (strain ATCC BAA-1392 / DSM 18658 / VKM B-2454 / MOB10) TaxID=886293 RepID=L0DQX1_SINAD|nr:DUF4091 domain-containing protein [Singulisphaera acidiphila]AGA31408.1 hypothetical protein Sinac_7369 [Singulisphaera acidiphila DSM 18658]
MRKWVPQMFLAATMLVGAGVAGRAEEASTAKSVGNEGAKVSFWLETSLKRIFTNTAPGAGDLQLIAARNGKIAFQVGFRNERTQPVHIECKLEGADDLKPQVRFVGLVPMPHFTPGTPRSDLEGLGSLPGLVPDPLWPLSNVEIGPMESRSFWVTLNVPADVTPGPREVKVQLSLAEDKAKVELPVALEISSLVIKPRRDFPVIHWWRGEATWDYYKTGMFEDERWWKLTRDQLKNMLDHGSDVVYVPVFFNRRETFKHPCQLLIVKEPKPGVYEFDWTLVKRFSDMVKEIGFTQFEWSHLWIYWGVENPMRIYKKEGDQYVMLWEPTISGFSDTYVNFLKQFLPEFKKFLTEEKMLETSYFHLSDEPGPGQHVQNYRRARQILREIAPWMKVMDALSDIEYGKEGLTDIPIPLVSAAQAYIDAKIPHWVYYCCGPTGPWLNRFMDTPLSKIRMSGWLFYRHEAKGFLHWGFNYWDKMEREEAGDPFHDGSNASYPGIPFGDPFVIYPGPDGPIDSIRWEVFAESLQDYAILQTAGIAPSDSMLAELKSYADFPKDPEWLGKTLRKVLKSPEGVAGR